MSTPITTLMLYRTELQPDGVVLDSDAHTRMLNTVEKFPVTNCTFQRQNREMRLPLSMDVAGRYNYGSFVNNGRTFYCFITEMEYVNDNMTKASYNIDFWHTYQGDIQYRPSFIERKLVARSDDIFGKYTLSEPVEVNRWVLKEMDGTNREPYRYVMIDSGFPNAPDINRTSYGPLECAIHVETGNDLSDIMSRLEQMLTRSNNIESLQGVWAVPCRVPLDKTGGFINGYSLTLPTSIGGRPIKNKKSLLSPYCFVGCYSSDGGSSTWEIQDVCTDGETVNCNVEFSLLPTPELLGYPANAFGEPNSNALMSIACDNLPQPNIAINAITISNTLKLLGNIVGIGSAAWMGNAQIGMALNRTPELKKNRHGGGGAVSNRALSNVSLNQQMVEAASAGNIGGAVTNMADTALHMQAIVGTKGAGASASAQLMVVGLNFALFVPDDESFKAVDDFFSRYGYAIGEIQDIELNNRSLFEYVKTQDASISVPNAPVDAEIAIKELFDSGLTLFHDYQYFKRYDMFNA